MQQFAWRCGAITRLVRWVPDSFQHARAAKTTATGCLTSSGYS